MVNKLRLFWFPMLLAVIFSFLSYLFYISLSNFLLPVCTKEGDIYNISEWSECNNEGFQIREVKMKEEFSCRISSANEIIEPVSIKSCTYFVCDDKDFNLGPWGLCIDGKQQREVYKKSECSLSEENKKSGKYASERNCVVGDKKTTSLIKNYITLVDVNGGTSENNNNLVLAIKGKVGTASLVVTGKTQVFGGNSIKIADNYAFYLHIDSDGIPRAVGTSRVGGNLLTNNVPGMFKGLDTPKTLTFDLSDLQLAKSSKEGDGYIKKNFVEILNNYSGKSVDMTLFMAGGGKSMREADPKKRIYAVIESAFIEYECEKDSACEIAVQGK